MGGRPMHLPKPVGPFHVSFADFELRPGNQGEDSSVTIHPSSDDAEMNAFRSQNVPPMRIFYPTAAQPRYGNTYHNGGNSSTWQLLRDKLMQAAALP